MVLERGKTARQAPADCGKNHPAPRDGSMRHLPQLSRSRARSGSRTGSDATTRRRSAPGRSRPAADRARRPSPTDPIAGTTVFPSLRSSARWIAAASSPATEGLEQRALLAASTTQPRQYLRLSGQHQPQYSRSLTSRKSSASSTFPITWRRSSPAGTCPRRSSSRSRATCSSSSPSCTSHATAALDNYNYGSAPDRQQAIDHRRGCQCPEQQTSVLSSRRPRPPRRSSTA